MNGRLEMETVWLLCLQTGRDQCVSCLGPGHAIAAHENPASCMNYFILPVMARRPCACCLRRKQPFPLQPDRLKVQA